MKLCSHLKKGLMQKKLLLLQIVHWIVAFTAKIGVILNKTVCDCPCGQICHKSYIRLKRIVINVQMSILSSYHTILYTCININVIIISSRNHK